jgi:flagellin-like hook-associated protein FlgL
MGMSVVNNLSSLAGVNALNRTSDALVTAHRRLATGFRVTRAADDASGLSISEGLRSQASGMSQAVRNAQDGIGILQLADGALGDMTALLGRMRDLSVQAANTGALNSTATADIQKELGELGTQIDQIAGRTSFNRIPLLDGTYDREFQVGANYGETIRVRIGGPGFAIDRAGLGLSGLDVTGPAAAWPTTTVPAVTADQGPPASGRLSFTGDWTTPGAAESNFRSLRGTVSYNGRTFDLGSVDYSGAVTPADHLAALNTAARSALGTSGPPLTATAGQLTLAGDTPGAGTTAAQVGDLTPAYAPASGADGAIIAIDQAIKLISVTRAELGGTQNRFEHTVARLSAAIEDTTASDSRIRDTNMATEFSEMNRQQILTQAGTAVLAQSSQSSQAILKLLAA